MNFPLLDSFLTMLWFFLWVMWLFLLFRVVLDIFRDDDLSGAAKAAWLIFILVLPFLGVLVYLIVRGSSMGARAVAEAHARQEAIDDYIRTTAAGGTGPADELSRLAALRADGTLNEQEFQQAKAKLLA
ncbi:MAG TPA: SHOCT domain-containing protein [Actinocrinis sp.]|uniref:SHOCT domain-containing protein n=1 Tax=Actinocrinis sp. TaxID=1920516 RepID=UPI002DDDAB40|nr:SHOCT domain-containing protein [Actinocrinis sp.]HEV2342651.1 SHOCT domain-containing protein [Actinocrinis sp.]